MKSKNGLVMGFAGLLVISALALGGEAEARTLCTKAASCASAASRTASRAVLWSTFLPGAGYFALGEPGRAFSGLGLNLFFTAAAVISFEEDLPLAGLVFLLAEIALYRGGREAVREAAEAQLAAQERERREVWVRRHGERELLGVGMRLRFGKG